MTDTATHSEARTTDVAPRIATWSFVAALAIVGVAAAYVLWRDRGWLSSSDLAFFEIELMRMPGEWPLVGVYSRYGWSHPGPLLYYLLWGPWRLFGGASVGLLFGMLLLHLSALVIAWFAARFRSLAAAVLVAGALLTVWAVGPESEALLPWNPMVGLLYGGTAVVVAWNASLRGRLGTLLLFPIGSLLVQAHVSTAPVVLALFMGGALLALWSRGQTDALPWRWWMAGAAIAVVLWLPPLIDQFTGSGNFRQILSSAAAGGPALGLRQGATVLIDAFSIPPYWWNPEIGLLPTEWHPPWLLILPILALAVALVRRDPSHLRFLAIATVALTVAGLGVSRFMDSYSYLGAWIPGIAMVTVALSLWILVAAAGGERLLLLASPVLLVLPALGVATSLVTNPPPLDHNTAITQAAAGAVAAEGLQSTGVHLSTAPEDRDLAFGVTPAIAAELQRVGVPLSASMPTDWPARLRALIPSDPDDRAPLLLREVRDPEASVPEGWRVLAEGDPFTPDEWRQIRELRRAATDPSLTADEQALSVWALAGLRRDRYAWQILAPAD